MHKKNVFRLLGIASILFFWCWTVSKADASSSGNVKEKPRPPVSFCPSFDLPPTIDGKIGEREWEGASKVSGFISLKGSLAKKQTDVFIARDKKNLYFGFRCYEPKLEELKIACRSRSSSVWADDGIEVFVRTDIG